MNFKRSVKEIVHIEDKMEHKINPATLVCWCGRTAIGHNYSELKNHYSSYSTRIVAEALKQDIWIDSLKTKGFVAAHPDSSWYDRTLNKIILVKPYYINEKKMIPGCLIAIGDETVSKILKVQDIRKPGKHIECWLEPERRGLIAQTMNEIGNYWNSLFSMDYEVNPYKVL